LINNLLYFNNLNEVEILSDNEDEIDKDFKEVSIESDTP